MCAWDGDLEFMQYETGVLEGKIMIHPFYDLRRKNCEERKIQIVVFADSIHIACVYGNGCFELHIQQQDSPRKYVEKREKCAFFYSTADRIRTSRLQNDIGRFFTNGAGGDIERQRREVATLY